MAVEQSCAPAAERRQAEPEEPERSWEVASRKSEARPLGGAAMAFIIDSLQNYQQEIVDHFKADETRRAKFDAHMRNARYREVLLRNRDPAKQAGQDRSRNSRGRKLVGPQEGEDPVDYYLSLIHI